VCGPGHFELRARKEKHTNPPRSERKRSPSENLQKGKSPKVINEGMSNGISLVEQTNHPFDWKKDTPERKWAPGKSKETRRAPKSWEGNATMNWAPGRNELVTNLRGKQEIPYTSRDVVGGTQGRTGKRHLGKKDRRQDKAKQEDREVATDFQPRTYLYGNSKKSEIPTGPQQENRDQEPLAKDFQKKL